MKKLVCFFKIMLLGLVISPFFSSNVTKTIPLMSLDQAYKIVNAYRLFGLNKEATLQELTKAWKAMSRKWHPDKAPSDKKDEYSNKMKQINPTYDDLKIFMNSPSFTSDRDYAWSLVEQDEKNRGPAPSPTPPRPTPAPEPSISSLQKAVKKADVYIQSGKASIVASYVINFFELAIKTLKPFIPDTSAKIIETYNELIEHLLQLDKLDEAYSQFIKAERDQKDLEKAAGNLPKFKEASQNLKILEITLFNKFIWTKPQLALSIALSTFNSAWVQRVVDGIDDRNFLFQNFWSIAGKNDPRVAEIIKIMLAKRNEPFININQQAPSGMTTLMRAAEQGSFKAIQELLNSKGIDVNVQNIQKNKTALDYAVERNDQQIIEALKSAGAKPYAELQQSSKTLEPLALTQALNTFKLQLETLSKALYIR